MPKDEFDREDPLELNGQVIPCEDDHDDEMAIAFIEEFLLLNFTPDRILRLFENPGYVGPHRVYRNKGRDHVRNLLNNTIKDWTPTL